MHLKVVKCLATLCLTIGIFGVCGLNVHAESAALKKGSNTAAVNISKDGWTITAAFRKSNSSHIMKTKRNTVSRSYVVGR